VAGGTALGEGSDEPWLGALVLCTGDAGRPSCAKHDDEEPLPYLLDLTETYGAPVILTNMGTIQVGTM